MSLTGPAAAQWHPTLLISTLFPTNYTAAYLSGSLVLRTTLTFRSVRYVPLGGVSQIVPAVQYYSPTSDVGGYPGIRLPVPGRYIVQDGVVSDDSGNTVNLKSSSLSSTNKYSVSAVPESDFATNWLSKRSNMYLIDLSDNTPELGQLVYRIDGTWYGGVYLQTEK